MMVAIVSVAVALVAFILYALDCRSKEKPIAWPDALKLSLFSGLISSGVVFATSSDVKDVAEVVTAVAEPAQDMFIGVPNF